MFASHTGEFAALAAAIFWTATALSFETASKRLGSLTVNVLRLYFAFIFYTLFLYFTRGLAFPTDATPEAWLWLSLSGLVGFVIGDQFLFMAFVRVGARISMLIMALVPPITTLIGWIILDETMTIMNFLGMGLTLTGVAMVVLKREFRDLSINKRKKVKFSYPRTGIFFAIGGAFGQAVGLILSKIGMKDYNAFAASQIRVLAGLTGFTVLTFILHNWKKVSVSFSDRKGMTSLATGSVFGPFLGVSFSLLAIQNTTTGIAATIMAIVPVLIIPPAILFFKEKVNTREIIGAFVAIAGVALLFLF